MPTIHLSLREDVTEGARRASNSFGNFVTSLNQGLELVQRVGGQAYRALDEMFESAGKSEQLRSSFVAMAGGVEQADAMLAAVKTTMHGAISSVEAMEIANTAMSFGIVETADDMAGLVEVGSVLAKSLGQDASKGVADLTLALSRQSPMILDNLGISLKLTDAYEGYAKTLHKSASQLTETEKSQAFMNEALRLGREKVAALGGNVATAADKWNSYKAALEDLKTVSTEEIVDAIKPIAEMFGADGKVANEESIRGFGALAEVTVRTVTDSLDSLSDSENRFLKSLGDAIDFQLAPMRKLNREVQDFGRYWDMAGDLADKALTIEAQAAAAATAELKAQEEQAKKTADGYTGIYINSQGVITNLREGSAAAKEFEQGVGRIRETSDGTFSNLSAGASTAAARIERIDGKIVLTNQSMDDLARDSVGGLSYIGRAANAAGDAIEDGIGGGAEEARAQIEKLRDAVIGENTGLIADLAEAFGPDMFSEEDSAFATWIDREKAELLARQEELMGPIADGVEGGIEQGLEDADLEGFGETVGETVRRSLIDVMHDKELVKAVAGAFGIFTGQGIGDTAAGGGQTLNDLDAQQRKQVENIMSRGAFDAIVSQGLQGAMTAIEKGDLLALKRIREGALDNARNASRSGNRVHNREFIESNKLLADLVRDLAKAFSLEIPGFAQGGVGNFGRETLAMLHGREAIVPLARGGTEVRDAIMGGDVIRSLESIAMETRLQTEVIGNLLSDVAINTRVAAEGTDKGGSTIARYQDERLKRAREVSRDPGSSMARRL